MTTPALELDLNTLRTFEAVARLRSFTVELRGASFRRPFWFVFRRERAHRGGATVRALPSG